MDTLTLDQGIAVFVLAAAVVALWRRLLYVEDRYVSIIERLTTALDETSDALNALATQVQAILEKE